MDTSQYICQTKCGIYVHLASSFYSHDQSAAKCWYRIINNAKKICFENWPSLEQLQKSRLVKQITFIHELDLIKQHTNFVMVNNSE